MAVYQLLSNVKAIQTIANVANPNQIAAPLSQNNPNSPAGAHAFVLTVTGPVAAAATVQCVGSNDGVNFDNYGATFTATVGASGAVAVKSQAGTTPFNYVGAFITAISGTGASASLNVSA